MNSRVIAEVIFRAGIEGVLPSGLIRKALSLEDNILYINDLSFDLDSFNNIFVIGAGKASAMMGAEVEKILGDRITGGCIVVKYGHSCRLDHIKVAEAGHPVPDTSGFRATEAILKISAESASGDLVICLLSGGGSALLADYPDGTSPEEMILVNDLLVKCGCTIREINTVRKHLSEVKGGQLSRAVYPATLVSLMLSDVAGDPPDVIASGPTTYDPTTFREALEILDRHGLTPSVPDGILDYLKKGEAGMIPETPKYGDQVFSKTFNTLVGNNLLALEAAGRKAAEFSLNTFIISDRLEGDTVPVSEYLVATALKYQSDKNVKKPACILFGGETTVRMTGKGLGGRNQHLALYCATILREHPGITILAGGTDGTDGPTDAAGAVADSNTFEDALSENIDPGRYLREFDSYNFFHRAGGHIITGPTMTNVMDIIVIIVE
jgi:glycerate 2-kinase